MGCVYLFQQSRSYAIGGNTATWKTGTQLNENRSLIRWGLIKGADLEDEFLFQILSAFRRT